MNQSSNIIDTIDHDSIAVRADEGEGNVTQQGWLAR